MAILQSRMIALINAAADYQTGLRQIIKTIQYNTQRFQQGKIPADEALLDTALKANELNLLEDAVRSQSTISGEHYRYNMNKKRNEWNRQYQERRRGGVTVKHHVEPDYATAEFNTTVQRITPFRAEGQNQGGFTPNKGVKEIDYIPGELPARTKERINREIEESLGTDIPKGQDLAISNEEVDIDFPRKSQS